MFTGESPLQLASNEADSTSSPDAFQTKPHLSRETLLRLDPFIDRATYFPKAINYIQSFPL